MNREIKIGDWGWFWDEGEDSLVFGELLEIYNCSDYPYSSEFACFTNFSHEHPTGRFVVTENPNSVSNDPYADLKKAYREGKIIQMEVGDKWADVLNNTQKDPPEWCEPPKNYRIKPKPQYRPYTFNDREEFKGKWVRFKPNTKIECAIIRITEDDVFIEGEGIISYEDALSRYEYIDGSPFGKLIEE